MTGLIHRLFEEQVAAIGQSVALIHEGESFTYAELNARANRLARYLRGHGAGPGRLVGIYLERGASLVVGLLAILKTGGAYVPLDPIYPAERLAHMLEDAAPCAVLTQEKLRRQLPGSGAAVIALDSAARPIAACDPVDIDPGELDARPQHLAYVIYTSGSTGRPKGVMIEHAAVVNFLRSMQKQPGMSAADRLLAVTTVAFDIAALELYLPLITGATVVLASAASAADADSLARLLEIHDITVMQATPATWKLLLHGGWTGRKALKVLCGGEALGTELSRELLERVASVWNMYGPTETTIWSCARRIDALERVQHTEPIGGPIDNTQLHILDEHLQPVPSGAVGEIYIGGAGVARGYLHRAELTAERFVRDPFAAAAQARMYRTGDLGRWRQDGAIDFLGRTDHQVKIRGYRIELGEIEAQLVRHADVREAAVLAREDEQGEKRLVAYLVPRDPSAPPTVERLRRHLGAVLPEYMVPSAYVALERFPLTPNGKLDRRALPGPEAAAQLPRSHEPAEGEVEELLAGIWQALLRLERVGRNDDFFELGGYSMLALDLRRRIESELGLEIPLSALIEAPTVARLAQLIAGRAARDSMVLIREGEGGTPVFLLHDGDGETLLYRNLALRLDRRHAVFGLNPHALPGVPMAHTRIRDMAAYHIERIRSVQPHGPYLLGGMCAGGIIAFEMALQLQAKRERVALIALLDAAAPQAALKPWRFAKERLDRVAGELRRAPTASAMHRAVLVAGSLARKLRSFTAYQAAKTWREMRDNIRLRLLRTSLDRGRRPPKLIGRVSATITYLYAQRGYRPGRQLEEGELVLFRATRGDGIDAPFVDFYEDPLLGWSGLSRHGVRAVDVPGGHTSMLQEPHVEVLARRMQDAIDESPAGERAIGSGAVRTAR
ncbi:MAG: non-ribosomal peptide synthetase [Steroidobacteraceae bacterium]